MSIDLLSRAKSLPAQPGVYKFYNDQGELLYVGKAKNLKNRVSSYWQKNKQLTPIKLDLVKKTSVIDYIVVNNENEALFLETTLIKKQKPPYNIVLKDDKSWQYIAISQDKLPKVFLLRYHDIVKKNVANYKIIAGPFYSGFVARQLIKLLRQIFPWHETNGAMVEINKKHNSPFHLGRYVNNGLLNKKQWLAQIKQIIKILNGQNQTITNNLRQEITSAIKKLEFEKAQVIKNRLKALENIKTRQNVITTKNINEDYVSIIESADRMAGCLLQVRNGRVINKQAVAVDQIEEAFAYFYPPNSQWQKTIITDLIADLEIKTKLPKNKRQKNLLDLTKENAAQLLAKIIKIKNDQAAKRIAALNQLHKSLKLNKLPKRIECYDVSNFQGQQMVAAMTVAIDGLLSHKDYRRFKIKKIKGIDDPAAMAEVLSRRLKHINWSLPDLIIVDGGVTQVSAVKQTLNNNNLDIPLYGLAKKFELLIAENNRALKLDRYNSGLQLIQSLRDEAHRFAITYHRLLRKKSILSQ
jgi:excinuclease ABC subunit C